MPHQHKQQLQQLQPAEHAHLKKMAANGTAASSNGSSSGHRSHHNHHRHPQGGEKLQHLSGMLEVKFKGGAFSTWSDVFVRLEGRWLTVHKRERDSLRIGAVELGPGVEVTDLNDTEASTKFPRRFDLLCKGGSLPATEMGFRTKSRKDRDLWALAIATNIHILTTVGLDLSYAIADLEPVITRMKEALPLTPIRIRSDLAIRCSSGEDIVAFLVAEELATDRTHANIIGRRLLAMNVIHHVVWEKGFVDASEQYTLSELDEELGYEVEHFQKYLDSRKFWKYFDSDASSSNSSTRSGRSGRGARSAASMNGSTVGVPRGSAATQSQASVSSQDEASSASASAKLPPSLDAVVADKKAKHCGVCKKGFNPLRRRYVCRSCAATVCSHCSMSRKVESADEGSVTARVCVGCKLSAGKSQEDFYDQIFTGPQLTATTSTSERSNVSGSDRASSFSQASTSSALASSFASEKRVASSSSIQQHAPSSSSSFRRKSSTMSLTSTGSGAAAHAPRRLSISSSTAGECPFCMNEGCGPLRDYFEVPYPVAQEVVDRDGCNYITANELDNEHARLRSVRILIDALATGALTQSLLHFCSMATIATSSPIALVGLLARSEYVVVAQNGEPSLMDHSIPRDKSFAAHTCRNGVPLVCSDVSRDVRFAGNPWRRDVLHASFYAGIPITLSDGHTVGAIEVFDVNARYACTEIVTQLQAVVRGVVKKMDDVVASAPMDQYPHHAEEYEMDDLASVSSIDSSMSVESRPDTSVAHTTASPPAPATAVVQEDESNGNGDAAAAGTQPSDNEMELRLMELLSQTTTTQEQLRNQQGHMVHAISSHSKQITELAKQLERMESTLNAKLGGDDGTP